MVQANLIRANSETPSIQNYHDARAFRFAYGNQSGIVPNVGQEITMTGSGTNLHIGTGEIVHQGWQVSISGLGLDINLPKPTSSTVVYYYSVYLEINLKNGSNQYAGFDYSRGTGTYPSVPVGDDLTQVTDGTARLLVAKVEMTYDGLHHFSIQPQLKIIQYNDQIITELDGKINDLDERITGDISDLEGRLDALGFKEGVATLIGFSTTASVNSVKKVGKYILFDLKIGSTSSPPWTKTNASSNHYISVPTWARPKKETKVIYQLQEMISGQAYATDVWEQVNYSITTFIAHETTISTSGLIYFKALGDETGRLSVSNGTAAGAKFPSGPLELHCGWEIE